MQPPLLSELTVLFNLKFKISYLSILNKPNDLKNVYQEMYLSVEAMLKTSVQVFEKHYN